MKEISFFSISENDETFQTVGETSLTLQTETNSTHNTSNIIDNDDMNMNGHEGTEFYNSFKIINGL